MRVLRSIIMLFILALLLLSCKEDVEEGQNTMVNGEAFDLVKNQPLAGANILLLGCNTNFYNDGCVNVLDSVRTGADGKFSFNFITSGKESGYIIKVEDDSNFIFSSEETITPGVTNEIVLDARELNILKVQLEVENNNLGPIRLRTVGGNINIIHQNSRDTVVYGKVLPSATNWFTFDVIDPEIDPVNPYRSQTDTIEVDLSDTIVYVKKIVNPKDWPVN
ncbi:hypothetical protein [Catalinimonas niigatensis]|uniref:hypothetical protein n=1 Tax=Catalinimonas niigatensis TaxID=1397264 RepID=UPI0026659DA5|nr:hypothetical protein [Catalinimonas niigatensis]WPP49953.1 hypothetical protein PZB72_25145 [Catalinimonas niigatensis]